MKLKRIPEDFQVDEQMALQPSAGPFALYRLTKQSLGTREALDAVAQRWNLPRGAIAFAGLKDRHALTRQFVTIHGGPRRGLSQTNFELEYLGPTPQPVHASDLLGNRFQVVIRDLTADDSASIRQALAALATGGLPNYFDNQRFGSLGVSGQFIAQPWCLGDYERAVWLAIAEENVHDRPRDQDEKRMLRDQWGDWRRCRDRLHEPERRRVVEFLAGNPGDFRRAMAAPQQDLRSLWLAAFQSHLWNQLLAAAIRQQCGDAAVAKLVIGGRELPFMASPNAADRAALGSLLLPLPSARLHLDEGPLKSLIDRTLAAEGLELRQVRVKYPRDSFFSKGERAALLLPAELALREAADELYPGRLRLTLEFTLPKGSYATILIKRVIGIDPEAIPDDDDDGLDPAGPQT